MNHKYTVNVLINEGENSKAIYSQTVDDINIGSIVAAVNRRDSQEKAPIRHRAPRSDRGKRRAKPELAVGSQLAPAA